MRRFSVWLISIPLMVVGSQVAHALAFGWVYPDAAVRWHELLLTGHRYTTHTSQLAAVVIALLLFGFAGSVLDAACGRASRPLRPWMFALLPPLAFTLQEIIERWIVGSNAPWQALQEPTFRPGLLLQLPFALLAFVAVRLLLRTARSVGRAFAAAPIPQMVLRVVAATLPPSQPQPSLWFACTAAPRGPPVATR